MAEISTESAEVGMVVTENVVTNRNMMIVPAGTTLTEKHINLFKTWGISHISIEGEEEESTLSTLSGEQLEALKLELKKRYEHVDLSTDQSALVYSMALKQLAEVHDL